MSTRGQPYCCREVEHVPNKFMVSVGRSKSASRQHDYYWGKQRKLPSQEEVQVSQRVSYQRGPVSVGGSPSPAPPSLLSEVRAMAQQPLSREPM